MYELDTRGRLIEIQYLEAKKSHDLYDRAFHRCELEMVDLIRERANIEPWVIEIASCMAKNGRLTQSEMQRVLSQRKRWIVLTTRMRGLASVGYKNWPQWWQHPNNELRSALDRATGFVKRKNAGNEASRRDRDTDPVPL